MSLIQLSVNQVAVLHRGTIDGTLKQMHIQKSRDIHGVEYGDSIRKTAKNLQVVEYCIQFHHMLLKLCTF